MSMSSWLQTREFCFMDVSGKLGRVTSKMEHCIYLLKATGKEWLMSQGLLFTICNQRSMHSVLLCFSACSQWKVYLIGTRESYLSDFLCFSINIRPQMNQVFYIKNRNFFKSLSKYKTNFHHLDQRWSMYRPIWAFLELGIPILWPEKLLKYESESLTKGPLPKHL